MSQFFTSSTPCPLTAIIVGAGHRALLYASYAQQHPDELRSVGVADLNPLRHAMAAELYGLSPEQCFESAGEIQGVFEDGRFVIRHIDPRPGHEYIEDVVDLTVGGDMRLVAGFLRVIRGEAPSISTTPLEDSVAGHLIGFSADRAMTERRMVDLVFGV